MRHGWRQHRTVAHVEDDERGLSRSRLGQGGQFLDFADGDAQPARLHQLFELSIFGPGECCGQSGTHGHLIKCVVTSHEASSTRLGAVEEVMPGYFKRWPCGP